ncbi:hypothetical protein D3C76_1341930 [compost metagenome]
MSFAASIRVAISAILSATNGCDAAALPESSGIRALTMHACSTARAKPIESKAASASIFSSSPAGTSCSSQIEWPAGTRTLLKDTRVLNAPIRVGLSMIREA